jgi:hypothetical protein
MLCCSDVLLRIDSYVLAGFPRSFAEAYSLFAIREDASDWGAADPSPDSVTDVEVDASVLCNAVVVLDGEADVLERRVRWRVLQCSAGLCCRGTRARSLAPSWTVLRLLLVLVLCARVSPNARFPAVL